MGWREACAQLFLVAAGIIIAMWTRFGQQVLSNDPPEKVCGLQTEKAFRKGDGVPQRALRKFRTSSERGLC